MPFADAITLISNTNPMRSVGAIPRRITKIQEEVGEVAEAFLGVTSARNAKGMRWQDVREESIDVLTIAMDILLVKHNSPADAYTELLLPELMSAQVGHPSGRDYEAFEDGLADLSGHAAEAYTAARSLRRILESDLRDETSAQRLHRTAKKAVVLQVRMLDIAAAATRLAFTRGPGETMPQEELAALVEAEFRRKLGKWAASMSSGASVV